MTARAVAARRRTRQVAGVSWHCSQKIHNQMHGFERAMRTCEYVIVLDDDIKLHPGTIRCWVEELESDARVSEFSLCVSSGQKCGHDTAAGRAASVPEGLATGFKVI